MISIHFYDVVPFFSIPRPMPDTRIQVIWLNGEFDLNINVRTNSCYYLLVRVKR